MEYEWGPWIEHDGYAVPMPKQLVQCTAIVNRVGDVVTHPPLLTDGTGRSWRWAELKTCPSDWQQIVRYRVRRPRVTEWLSEINVNLPESVDA